MHEMPLINVFGGWGFGFGASIFCTWVLGNDILLLAFCPEIVNDVGLFFSITEPINAI